MQMLEFVNVSGPEPWKNKEAKKFVRSHAMKDFRRRQREGTGKGKRKGVRPGEGSFTLLNQKSAPSKISRQNPNTAIVLPFRPTSEWSPGPLATQGLNLRISTPSPLYALGRRFPNGTTVSQQPPLHDFIIPSMPSPSPSVSSDSSSRSSLQGIPEAVKPSLTQDFNLSVSVAVYSVLDGVSAQFDKIIRMYFASVHSYLTFVHKQRFFKRLAASKTRADAEVALLLLAMHLVAEPLNCAQTGVDPSRNKIYLAAKNLHSIVHSSKGPSLELLQAGLLITLYEHNAALPNIAYETLFTCSGMASFLGLDISQDGVSSLGEAAVSAYEEERRRTYWALVSLDCIVALHDEKHERLLVTPTPSLTDVLPSTKDADWENTSDDLSPLNCSYSVSSKLPQWADSFCRQGQSARLMAMVQEILRRPFADDRALMRRQILRVDQLLQENLTKLLFDCNGSCTQYCGPISLTISGSYLLHEFQLLATMTSSESEDVQAAYRSKLAIEGLIQMMVDILRMFPIEHLPELAPSALFCPYMAAMLTLQLDRINGVRSKPTLAGNDFELFKNSLKHFSAMWNCTAEYVKVIQRAQSRALPTPFSVMDQGCSYIDPSRG